MTLAVRNDAVLAPITDLAAWAHQAREASQVATSLARTPFVPQSLREMPRSRDADEIERAAQVTAGNITAAILTGTEVGLPPMAALRSLDVIQGTPAFRAITLRALVLSHGHDMWLAESTGTRAIVRGRRANSAEVQESVWNLDRARGLNLLGKDNWKKQPAAMLIARATAECARLVAPDVIMAVPYAIEELEDGEIVEAPPQPPPTDQPTRRTARRRTQPATQPVTRAEPAAAPTEPDPEPDFDEQPEQPQAEQPQPDPEPERITKPQQAKLHALFNANGLKDRDERLAFAGGWIGRDLASSNDLAKDEASRLIDHLEHLANDQKEEPTA